MRSRRVEGKAQVGEHAVEENYNAPWRGKKKFFILDELFWFQNQKKVLFFGKFQRFSKIDIFKKYGTKNSSIRFSCRYYKKT